MPVVSSKYKRFEVNPKKNLSTPDRKYLSLNRITADNGYEAITKIYNHIITTLSKENKAKLYVCDHWVSAADSTAMKAYRRKCKMGLSYVVSTALNKFSESKKDCALFFLHVCIDKLPPRGPPTFHAWVLFFSKTESVLVLFNPYEEHLDNLPVVPSEMYKLLKPKARNKDNIECQVQPGFQRMDESNCVLRCVKFALALVRRTNLQWSNGSFLADLPEPYEVGMCKRK